jgi:helicase
MAFRGLFIGIDRYASSGINWLNCASRDARALEAQFGDTLGGSTTLLVDADATRARIAAEFDCLAQCGEDDTVVIGFSGHGSEQQQLVTYDADPKALATTGIPLDELTDWFRKIPARHLVLLLDCCFSGGAGAKVLKVDNVARGVASVEATLEQMAGDGRLIVTASAANEAAWESQTFGHGYFTYYLLEVMRGVPEVVEGGRLPIYRLLEYVTRRVIGAASTIGEPQNPTLRGTIEGDVTWPVFVPGAKVKAAFPEAVQAPVSKEIGSLAHRGFAKGIVETWGKALPSLNELQISAINDYGVLEGENIVVVAPTSSGKTMIGELAALHAAGQRKRTAFLLPLKALVADKRRYFASLYVDYGIRVVEATGDTDDISPVLRGQYDIGLFTYEKFASVALTYPHALEQVAVVVIDEVQMLADESRGANLEFLMTVITAKSRTRGRLQLIALSGVVGDTHGLERWLGARLLRHDARPVPLDEGLITGDGRRRFIDGVSGEEKTTGGFVRRAQIGKGSNREIVIPLVRKLVAEGQQVIVFREQVGETRYCAEYLAAHLNLPPAKNAIARLPQADPSLSSEGLRGALNGGVAFHNSHLSADEKRIVEEEFRASDAGIRVIVSTTTLAMGVNTPANSAVVVGLQHPGDKPYSIAEYKNVVGRAGRLGLAEHGASYLVAMTSHDEDRYWRDYVLGKPEALRSRFLDASTDPRSLIVRMLAVGSGIAGDGLPSDEIATLLESSFGAFQQRQLQSGWVWSRTELTRALGELVRHGLVSVDGSGRHKLTELGSIAGQTGLEVGSVVRLVAVLRHIRPDEISDPVLVAAVQQTLELDAVNVPMNKKTPKEAQTWLGLLRGQGILESVLSAFASEIREGHEQGARAKRTVAALAFIGGEGMSTIEKRMQAHGGGFGGSAGPIRGIAARTCDVIGTAGRIATMLHAGLELGGRIERLQVRLTLGIPGSVVDLGREAGQELSRGDYLALASAGLTTAERIREASDDEILACVEQSKDRMRIVREAGCKMALKVNTNEVLALAPYVP